MSRSSSVSREITWHPGTDLFISGSGVLHSSETRFTCALPECSRLFSDAGLAALGILGAELDEGKSLRISPLQLSLAAAALSSQGVLPAPRLALAVDTPQAGWVILPTQGEPVSLFSNATARSITEQLAVKGKPFWASVARVPTGTDPTTPVYTWFIGGTTSAWPGSPLALAFILEEDSPILAYKIGIQLLEETLNP